MLQARKFFSGKNATLLLDQVVCSASNAAAVMVAAFFLSGDQLNHYVTVQLIGTSLIGFQRSIFLDPSLVITGNGTANVAYGKWLWRSLGPCTVVALSIAYLLEISFFSPLTVLSILFPLVQDCLRYRSLAHGAYARTLVSDGVWLIALLLGTILYRPDSPEVMLALWGMSAAMSVPALLFRLPSARQKSLRAPLALGRYQVAEWTIASLTSVAPLLVVQAVLPVGSVAAFRLAQTAMGPLNTLNNFVMVRFLLGSSTLQSHDRLGMQRVVRHSSLAISSVTLVYGALACLGFYLAQPWLDPTIVTQVAYAVPVTVLAAVLMSPCTPYLGLARSLSLQRLTITPRFVVLVFNVLATAAGFWLWNHYRFDPLVVTILVTSMASLVTYRLMYKRTLSRAARSKCP
ncbi:hypothetical protein [Kocuria turfanensis]|uniref:Polysaccharide biosynthesis protein C-terminal domain-containing protein n=1 Tax=Kocuria turfanensis TaxID=388357 RepID=A0A512IA73_9MICC|nr:hypothetical protein [Kocuria turfanensis]GEO94599.1 hypothetical protein KTU01_07220 [Kocuria turfanensis]